MDVAAHPTDGEQIRRSGGRPLSGRIEIRPAAIADCDTVLARLDPHDATEAAAMADDPRQAVRQAFEASLIPPKLALVDGHMAALWGLCGHAFPNVGMPWLLLTTPEIAQIASYLRVARREVAAMLMIRSRLENYLTADYAKAIPLLEALGFHIDAPAPVGPKAVLFRKFWIEV